MLLRAGSLTQKDLGSHLFLHETHNKVLRVLEQAEALTQRYHIVVANPPYMGKGQNPSLKRFLHDNFLDYKADLFAAFIVRARQLGHQTGYLGFMCPFTWMFIASYEKLRLNILETATLTSLIQLEYSGFEGATVPICTFTFCNAHHQHYKGAFIRLSAFRGSDSQSPKALEAIADKTSSWFYESTAEDLTKIPGSPIAYWASKVSTRAFSNRSIDDSFTAKKGMAIGDNAIFLRLWTEVSFGGICRNAFVGPEDTKERNGIRVCNGGEFRKWSGNQSHVVNWKKRR